MKDKNDESFQTADIKHLKVVDKKGNKQGLFHYFKRNK